MSHEVTIQRHAAADNFTVLRNAVTRDEALSWKATGLLCYLLSLPSDWRLRLAHLATQKADGRDSTRAGLAELERAGYLRIERRRDAGKWGETVWHVTDTPAAKNADFPQKQPNKAAKNADLPRSDFPNTVFPNSENPTLQRTYGNKELIKKELKTPPPPRASAHTHAHAHREPTSPTDEPAPAALGGGGIDDLVFQTASKKLPAPTAQRVAQLARDASDEQRAMLVQLLANPASGVRSPAGWALRMAERATLGELTPSTSPGAGAAPAATRVAKVWKPEPRGEATQEGQAAGLAKARAALARLRATPKPAPAGRYAAC